MKIIYNQPLDLAYSTEIVIEQPKRKKRRSTTDTYDYDDPLIEHMENEDAPVSIEADLRNFFVYSGKLRETSAQTLKKYELRLRRKAMKDQMSRSGEEAVNSTANIAFAEQFTEKVLKFYLDERKRVLGEMGEYFKDRGSAGNENEGRGVGAEGVSNEALKSVINIDGLIEEYVLLEATYTNKSFYDISHDIVSLNGPSLSTDLLIKINQKMAEAIKMLTVTLNAKINELSSTKKYDKNVVFSICDLMDKKIRNYYLGLLIRPEPRRSYRRVRRDIFVEIFGGFVGGDFDHLKKLVHRFDYYKEKRKLLVKCV
ncbi:hypothetical protein THOM_0889 [Trachipleistophora hominis]|uniref:Uncharacterized protein n=1 Tax=Trachipleistophora hominis TaxID=72359 RepID=L7JXD3_TRAHO|nr:hypothetical protein THOM_0889 [Trachipleistophora hominis]